MLHKQLAVQLLCAASIGSLISPATLASSCAGPVSVSALGASGCSLGDVSFTNFSISNVLLNDPFATHGGAADPDQIMVDIAAGSLVTGPFTGIPGVSVVVSPGNAADWSFGGGGIGSGVAFTLSYSVATSAGVFDQYQVRGSGNSPFRGGTWSVTKDVTHGSGTTTVSVLAPFFVAPLPFESGVHSFEVTDTVQISGGIFTGSLSQFVNSFHVAPVPLPGALGCCLSGLLVGALTQLKTRRKARA